MEILFKKRNFELVVRNLEYNPLPSLFRTILPTVYDLRRIGDKLVAGASIRRFKLTLGPGKLVDHSLYSCVPGANNSRSKLARGYRTAANVRCAVSGANIHWFKLTGTSRKPPSLRKRRALAAAVRLMPAEVEIAVRVPPTRYCLRDCWSRSP